MQQVLVVIGDGAEVFDTLYPVHRIREDGFRVRIGGPEQRLYHLVLHDKHPDWDITVELPGYVLEADIAFRDVDPDEFAGLVLPGGRAPEYLRYDVDLLRITRQFAEQDKPVASICHGIEILAKADVVRGRRCTTIPKCRFDLEACGGTYVDERVVVDGNFVCARGKRDSFAFMREFMKVLDAYVDANSAAPASPDSVAQQR